MSVVGSDWEALKRFNVHELYQAALKPPAKPEEVAAPVEDSRGSKADKPQEKEGNVEA